MKQYSQCSNILRVLTNCCLLDIIFSNNSNIEKVMSKESLIQKLKEKLVMSVKDAVEILGNRSAFYRLAKKGEIVPVEEGENLGLFTLPEVSPEESSFAALSYYSGFQACICAGSTAASIYGLTDDYIDKIEIDIPYPNDMKNSLFEVHRVNPKKIEDDDNIIERAFPEKNIKIPVKIYSPEKTLHEILKYHGKSETFFKAIKRYHKKFLDRQNPGPQYDKILKIDKKKGEIIVDFLRMQGDFDE